MSFVIIMFFIRVVPAGPASALPTPRPHIAFSEPLGPSRLGGGGRGRGTMIVEEDVDVDGVRANDFVELQPPKVAHL